MQSPFVTLFLHIDDEDEYEEEAADIIEEILKQRLEGIKNEKGVYVTPTFPKLIYVLDENNNLTGGKYDYITKLAAKCSAKRMYPDYISAKKMREIYEGQVFSCMGCVDGTSEVSFSYNRFKNPLHDIPDTIHSCSIEEMWDKMSSIFEVKDQVEGIHDNQYIDTPGVKIFDLKDGFVDNLRIIRNTSYDWRIIEFENGTVLKCTDDHPFETENRGVVQAKDLTGEDIIAFNPNIPQQFEYKIPGQDRYRSGKFGTTRIKSITSYHKKDYSYDVTTSSEHFEVNGLYSHNCRSFLSPWKDENGNYKWEGRFNMGKRYMPLMRAIA